MKNIFAFAIIFVFCIPMLAIARRDTGPPEWTFDNVADLSDWRDSHGIAPITALTKVREANGEERNVLRIVATGENPYVYPGGSVANWEPFDGYEHGAIYIGLRVEKSDVWQIDYVTNKNTDYNEKQSKKFTVNASQNFVDVKLDMQWEGLIRGFRIHFGTSKRPIDIDYLSLQGPVKTSQQSKKLATTWGKVKDLL